MMISVALIAWGALCVCATVYLFCCPDSELTQTHTAFTCVMLTQMATSGVVLIYTGMGMLFGW